MAALTPCRFTVDQLTRLHAIVDAWNAVRRDDRRKATAVEVIDYMLTQEEIGIEAMTGDEMREELAREDLADEKPLPPIKIATPQPCYCGIAGCVMAGDT